MRKGLIVGKFMPPHLGHSLLIDGARSQCDELTVFVCNMIGQAIVGELRVSWLREIHPGVDVRLIDDLPPEQDNSENWAHYVARLMGRAPHVIFTSEDYGDDFARFAGCEHVRIDAERSGVRCSDIAARAIMGVKTPTAADAAAPIATALTGVAEPVAMRAAAASTRMTTVTAPHEAVVPRRQRASPSDDLG